MTARWIIALLVSSITLGSSGCADDQGSGDRDDDGFASGPAAGGSEVDPISPSADQRGSENAVLPWDECPVDACDPRQQNCTQGSCLLEKDNAYCGTSSGNAQEGDSCAGSDDCQPGLGCFQTSSGNQCRRACCAGDGTCQAGEHCGGGLLVDAGEPGAWGYCTPTVDGCDVFDHAAACEPGEGCYIVSPEGDTQCLRAGEGEVGDLCGQKGEAVQNACMPGMVCLASLECRALCSTNLSDVDCSEETVCGERTFTPDGVGVCQPGESTL